MDQNCDVAIIGGGPSGSTVGALLKKYNPSLNVMIFEREVFPRDHVGESLLPPISKILDEMGCWDKVEAADFPIKIGATYRWGKRPELWDFEFLASETFRDEPRPATFMGQRTQTSFQVDRSVYDKILLDQAESNGCKVLQKTKVSKVNTQDDKVVSLILDTGELVTARYYIDASGSSGILRRALSIKSDYPTTLRNIAIYDYWQNADWAVKIGVGGTRIQILSVGYGWIWFIPLSPTRTSIGLVIPVEHFKASGKTPAEIYAQALGEEETVKGLIHNAESEGLLQTTKDWSFLAERHCGENWFLVGECAGFADPILSAGVTMAQIAAQQAAYTILEMDRGKMKKSWLQESFTSRQTRRIKTHIRFADYWYTANEQFSDLQAFTSTLAKDIGLELAPDKAWAWIAQGGFIDEDLRCGMGGFSLGSIKAMNNKLGDFGEDSPFDKYNVFKLDLSGASYKERAHYHNGRVTPSMSYTRGERVLPVDGAYEVVVNLLQRTSDFGELLENLQLAIEHQISDPTIRESSYKNAVQILEAMITDGWIQCDFDPSQPLHNLSCEDRPVRWQSELASASLSQSKERGVPCSVAKE